MNEDLDALQGTWIVTSLESDGTKLSENLLGGARIVVKNDKFTSYGMGAEYKGVLRVETEKKQRTIDLLFTSGHAKGVKNLGIYKLLDDTWTICLAISGGDRPRSFKTAKGTGLVLETLRREKANAPAPKSRPKELLTNRGSKGTKVVAAASGVATKLEGEWQMVSAVFDGKPMDDAMVRWCKRITRGDTTKVLAGPQVFLNVTFTLDSAKNQGGIDYINLSGVNNGKKQVGIFDLRGAILRVCMSPPGKPRPKSFASRSGDGRSFTTWRLIE